MQTETKSFGNSRVHLTLWDDGKAVVEPHGPAVVGNGRADRLGCEPPTEAATEAAVMWARETGAVIRLVSESHLREAGCESQIPGWAATAARVRELGGALG